MRFLRRIDLTRLRANARPLERSELVFASAAIGLAFLIGWFDPPNDLRWQLLIVVWSGLVGMMIPRMIDARRGGQDDAGGFDHPAVRHDMASALLTIEGGVTALRYMNRGDENDDDVESIAHAIETEIRRIRRLSLLDRSSIPSCNVAVTVRPLIALHQANGANIEVDLAAEPIVAIAGDDLARVVANLLDNCERHAPRATISVTGASARGRYRLNVSDDGPGIARDIRSSAFKRGVSSRPGGGLGLFSVRSIVEGCGGKVRIDSSRRGTSVQIELPLLAAKAASGDGDPDAFQRTG